MNRGRPTESLSQKVQGAVKTRVTHQPGRMPPLQDVGAGRVWDEQGIGWRTSRIGRVSAAPHTPSLPGCSPHIAGRRECLGSGSCKSTENWQDRASGLVFLEPGWYMSEKLNR